MGVIDIAPPRSAGAMPPYVELGEARAANGSKASGALELSKTRARVAGPQAVGVRREKGPQRSRFCRRLAERAMCLRDAVPGLLDEVALRPQRERSLVRVERGLRA